jgi:hypothetical protein
VRAHPSGESMARGEGEGGFSSGALVMGSSSGGGGAPATGSYSNGDGGGDNDLEHQEENRAGGEVGSERDGRREQWSSQREGSSNGGGLDSQWDGDGSDGRSGQEARGGRGAQLSSRWDANGERERKGGTAVGSDFHRCDRWQGKETGRGPGWRPRGRERQEERGGP